MAEAGLTFDEDGAITLLDALDDVERSHPQGRVLADALDIHAELKAHADSRTEAAAESIRIHHLLPRWNES